MSVRIETVWPRWRGDWGNAPTYRLVMDGLPLPTSYATRAEAAKAKAMYDAVDEDDWIAR